MVGLKVGPIFYRIGTSDFLYAFFSNIAHHLENNQWGSRFPYLMNHLYQGVLKDIDIQKALAELTMIQNEFLEYHPSMVIWSFENLALTPPWGDAIAERITSLANYFYTNDGKELFSVFQEALETGIKVHKDVVISNL